MYKHIALLCNDSKTVLRWPRKTPLNVGGLEIRIELGKTIVLK